MAEHSTTDVVMLSTDEPVTVNNCAREPIHIPGAVQEHGSLLCLNSTYHIQNVTTNVVKFLGYTHEELLGKNIKHVFPDFNITHEQLQAFNVENTTPYKEFFLEAVLKGGSNRLFHLYCHVASSGELIVEIQPSPGDTKATSIHPLSTLNDKIGNLFRSLSLSSGSLYSILDVIADDIRAATGFDRVMVYEFDADWHGCVVVEKTRLSPSFLGLHFPASDIPPQARLLYTKNRMRLIPNVNYEASPMLPRPQRPIDMSFSVLRSVSPVHLQYLRNMGVGASLSISILVGVSKKLWGLICCHNVAPRHLTFADYQYCDLLGKIASAQVETLLQRTEVAQRLEKERKLTLVKDKLFVLDVKKILSDLLPSLWEDIIQVFDSDGLIYINQDHMLSFGETGRGAVKAAVVRWLTEVHSKRAIYCTNSTPRDLGVKLESGACCGIMAIPIKEREYLVLVRSEYVREVDWGGQPTKADLNGILNPRSSFASWHEIKRDMSMPWLPDQMRDAQMLESVLLEYWQRHTLELARLQREQQRNMKHALLRKHESEVLATILDQSKAQADMLQQLTTQIKKPLYDVLGNAELLSESIPNNSAALRHLQTIKSNSEHLLSVIGDMLEINNFDMNSIDIHNTPFDFYQKIEGIINSIYPVAANKGLDVAVQLPVDLPRFLIADPTRLAQMLLNLLSNAIVYTREGLISLSVHMTSIFASQLEVQFEVSDSGGQQSTEVLDEITRLQRDFLQGLSELSSAQSASAPSSAPSSTGSSPTSSRSSDLGSAAGSSSRGNNSRRLGLLVTHQLAKAMGGSVGSRIDPTNGGATFWIRLPLAKQIVSNTAEMPYLQLKELRLPACAIIVDERQWVQRWLANYLRKWQVEVVSTKDGRQIPELLQAHSHAAYIFYGQNCTPAHDIENVKAIRARVSPYTKVFCIESSSFDVRVSGNKVLSEQDVSNATLSSTSAAIPSAVESVTTVTATSCAADLNFDAVLLQPLSLSQLHAMMSHPVTNLAGEENSRATQKRTLPSPVLYAVPSSAKKQKELMAGDM